MKTFDENRDEFKPYGLTCELWTPKTTRRPDRHNEIEINYFTKGSITYLIYGTAITIPSRRLSVFWGLVPHQIIQCEGDAQYFVCTIPFSQFLEWKLPGAFVERILKGEVLIEATEEAAGHNEYLLQNWLNDVNRKVVSEVMLLEMRARLCRFALSNLSKNNGFNPAIYTNEISQVEKIAVFIAQNYSTPIKVADIGKAVGLHPDYANSVFKKAFGYTLSEFIIEERIAHAQRKLATSSLSITAIAFDCGFNSISRFNAAFMKICKCTPREFRKRFK